MCPDDVTNWTAIKNDDDHLKHHGILGMKWGVRRFQNSDGSLTAAGKKHRTQEENSSKKSVSNMSDNELRNAISRKQLESQYESLTRKPAKSPTVAGRLLREAAESFGRKALGKIVEKAIDKIFKEKEIPPLQKYSFDNPRTISLERLQEANKWYAALAQYDKNRETHDSHWADELLRHCIEIVDSTNSEEELLHYGIKGQKHGIRRFETEDGHLTEAGKERYLEGRATTKAEQAMDKLRSASKSKSSLASKGGSDTILTSSGARSTAGTPTATATTKKKSAEDEAHDAEIAKKRAEQQAAYEKLLDKDSKKKGKGGGGKGKKKDSGSGKEKAVEKQDWRDRFAEELKKANMSNEELEAMLNRLYPDRKKKIGIGEKAVKHSEDYLEHHGILGQKWGVRRYQNPDGSLTAAGKKRQVRILKEQSRHTLDTEFQVHKNPRTQSLIRSTKAFSEGSSTIKGQKAHYYTKEKELLAKAVLEEVGALPVSKLDRYRAVDYRMERIIIAAMDDMVHNRN